MTRVLIVSDHNVVRSGLQALLAGTEDVQVVATVSAAEALAAVEEQSAEVLILDLGRDDEGAEVLWRLGAEYATVPVIAVAQNASEPGARQALQAGARGYLLWDASATELQAAIRAVASGLLALQPEVVEAVVGRGPQPPTGTAAAEPLSPREREVLHLLAQGLPSKNIATRLHLSEHTVKFHIGSILNKLGVGSRTEAVAIAMRRGLIAL